MKKILKSVFFSSFRLIKMEKSQKLILDEEFSSSLPEPRRSIFIYEWLTYLSKVLPNVSKVITIQIRNVVNGHD